MMRIGVDIGGTFTDFVFHEAESGRVKMWKTPTTSPDPSTGVIQGFLAALGDSPNVLQQVSQIIHGTTIGANTILERKGAVTLLITTRGFRDVLEIQRQRRPNLYDMMQDKPRSLVPRNNVKEATERISSNGEILIPISEDEILQLSALIKEQGFESVAISFLHAYANPIHEQSVRRLLSEQLEGLPISLSSEISPKYREYERTNTTVANAYILPRVQRYLRSLRADLESRGYGAALFVMQSNGGTTTAAVAEDAPVRIIESGPAAGVIAAAHMAGAAGLGDVISFDMGGTTAKVSLIERGIPASTDEFEIDRRDLVPESGLPLSIPATDLIEIGAGGGSIARVSLGTIIVGPESTGADPGPVCYGRQAQFGTVTDADLVLGYLNPDYFLGGEMGLDAEGARTVLAEKVGQPLGLTVEQAAWGVHEVVDANMALAMREATIRRGHDPRDLTIVAFGGAGPIHACHLAKELGVPRVLIPLNAGVNSALGLLIAGARFDLVQTFVTVLDELSPEQLNRIYGEMTCTAGDLLEESHGGTPTFERSADMRYSGQGYEVTVPLPDGAADETTVKEMRTNFEAVYKERYGFQNAEAPIEVVNWRLLALGETPQIRLERQVAEREGTALARTGSRPAYFPEQGGYVDCPIYDWYRLGEGNQIDGPAIVEARETSALVLPGDRAVVDTFGNLLVHLR
ncbi:MAG: hydantoinase/oxoprolinase family protein [Actinobacteria bacterium]|nr:hydantoinase/oxoprolinase family protein [Actinomycetota bacterium]